MAEHWSGTFLDLERRLDEMFEKLIYRRWAIPNPAPWRPPLDVHESPDAYLIEIDLPGVPPDQVEIRIRDKELIVTGSRPETRFEGALLSHRERRCGPLRISLLLSQGVVPERTQAEWHHGTYVIHLFKKQEAGQPERTVAAGDSPFDRITRIASQ
jgi:HSP20 family molecular chaperone IbpA